MERIILIETSTALCSAALAENGRVISYRESSTPKAHAAMTAVFVDEILKECNLTISDCDAICVSMGPGSYTGLRVGVSTAKGLCFGSGKPLLAVGTLDTLVAQAEAERETAGVAFGHIVPMVDARRNEVYCAVFKEDTEAISGNGDFCSKWKQISETSPKIIDENSFADILSESPVLFIGDGAGKCADIIKHDNAHFVQCCPSAKSMVIPAMNAYTAGDFKDIAYFEPFYLKEFVATVSKKKLF